MSEKRVCANCGISLNASDKYGLYEDLCVVCAGSMGSVSDMKDEVRADRGMRANHIARWILVVPAFILAFMIPGIIVRILIDDIVPSFLFVELNPVVYIKGMSQIIQGIVDGVAPVYISMQIAPNRKKVVGTVTGILVVAVTIAVLSQSFGGYYRDVPIPTVLWNISLMLLTGISAAISVWYYSRTTR